MMWDENFQKAREDAYVFAHNRNKKLIEFWCEEAGVTSPVGYYNDYTTVYIYTDKPSCLIGKGGILIDKFKESLSAEFHKNMEVRIIEIRGGFVNLNL